MKISRFLIVFFLITPMTMTCQNPDMLKWNSENRLSWNDFQEISDDDEKANGMIVAIASVSYDYRILSNGKITPPVTVFNRSSSWSLTNDSLVLAHEQMHFDIHELYARKIRKEFLELYSNKENDTKKYKDILNSYLQKAEQINTEFDRDSYPFSKPRNESMEWINKNEFCEVLLKWQEKIGRELKELEAYSLN